MKPTTITPVFVDFIPEKLNEGVIYISESYNIIVHQCCCGCGQEVVTPLSPVDWQLKKEGKLITIKPSIGNWNYPCQSHYLITRNKVVWAGKMSKAQIQRVQERDNRDKQRYISQLKSRQKIYVDELDAGKTAPRPLLLRIWDEAKKLLGKLSR
jgi:Family of unknown function (DUF6527)